MMKYFLFAILSICFCQNQALNEKAKTIQAQDTAHDNNTVVSIKQIDNPNISVMVKDIYFFRKNFPGKEPSEEPDFENEKLLQKTMKLETSPPVFEINNNILTTNPQCKGYLINQNDIQKIIKGQSNVPPLFQYSPSNENLSLNDNFMLLIRHAETPKSNSINPDLSDTPINDEGIKHSINYSRIINQNYSRLYVPFTIRNVMTASAILGWDGSNWESFLQNINYNEFKQAPGIIELSLGNYEKLDKKKTLVDEKFIQTFNNLSILDGCQNSTGLELLKFSITLSLIANDKTKKNGIKMVICNSAMMGLLLNTLINQYHKVELKDIIPNNLDFIGISLEKNEDNIFYFRIYDINQVKQILDNLNIGEHVFPSICKKIINEKITEVEREATKINDKNILLRLI